MWRSNRNYPRQPGFNRRDPGSSFFASSSGAPPGLWSYEERSIPINSAVDGDRFIFPAYNSVPFHVFESGFPRRRTIVRQSIPIPAPYEEIPAPYAPRPSMALQNLRKEIYNPSPKSIFKRVSLYHRDNSKNNSGAVEDEDGKRCAVCLEDFESWEEVMVTPCNHMFHEACIVPWVTSHRQCPVCRAAILDGPRESPRVAIVDGTRESPSPRVVIVDGTREGPVHFNVPSNLPATAISWFTPQEIAEQTFARVYRVGR